jgi:glycosyltransferase involved in cell wall biosynthesis
MPKVSIIIPTHSRPELLPRAVESALRAGTDVEVIVVDDASVDSTAEVCRSFGKIKYIRLEHNQGVAGARNVGIFASSADFIAFLDDDDLRLPGSLDWQVEALLANKEAGFVCGPMLMADQEGNLTGEVSAPKGHEGDKGDEFWNLLELNFPVMPISAVIRKRCFSSVGLLKNNLHGIDDWDIFVRIAELYPMLVLDQPVGIYRKPTPFSMQGSSPQAQHLSSVARHQLELLRLPRARAASANKRREVRRRALSRIVDTLLWNAVQAIRQRAYEFACANVLAALRLNPRRALRPRGYRRLRLVLGARWSELWRSNVDPIP